MRGASGAGVSVPRRHESVYVRLPRGRLPRCRGRLPRAAPEGGSRGRLSRGRLPRAALPRAAPRHHTSDQTGRGWGVRAAVWTQLGAREISLSGLGTRLARCAACPCAVWCGERVRGSGRDETRLDRERQTKLNREKSIKNTKSKTVACGGGAGVRRRCRSPRPLTERSDPHTTHRLSSVNRVYLSLRILPPRIST